MAYLSLIMQFHQREYASSLCARYTFSFICFPKQFCLKVPSKIKNQILNQDSILKENSNSVLISKKSQLHPSLFLWQNSQNSFPGHLCHSFLTDRTEKSARNALPISKQISVMVLGKLRSIPSRNHEACLCLYKVKPH